MRHDGKDPMAILETERLVMRPLRAGDLDALCALYADPLVRRHFPDGTRTREQTKDELDWFVGGGDPDRPGLGLWATIHKPTGAFAGRCGLLPWTIDGVPEVEIAYLLDRRFWRQGLGAEAARALVRHGFERLGLARLVALIYPQNAASIRTAQSAGLAFEKNGLIDGERVPVYAVARGPV
jgi:RimJ/RimL family protein N-acetyltransferase